MLFILRHVKMSAVEKGQYNNKEYKAQESKSLKYLKILKKKILLRSSRYGLTFSAKSLNLLHQQLHFMFYIHCC